MSDKDGNHAASPFAIRPWRDDDRAFVVHSWSTSFEGAPSVRGADREHYRQEMRRAINRILDHATVRVACDPSDPDTIVGWVAFTGREFHYGYVKDAFRAECPMSLLLEGVEINAYTFRCRPIEHGLVGVAGCKFETDPKSDRISWVPPRGWRYTPRFTL